MKRAINRPRKSLWTRIKMHKYIYLMLLPVVIYYIVFHYPWMDLTASSSRFGTAACRRCWTS